MWEETVMSEKDTAQFYVRTRDTRKMLLAQAEISFKVGYDKAMAQLADMTEECKQLGRKEVVEWIKDVASLEEYKDGRKWRKDGMLIDWDDWQSITKRVEKV